MMDSGESTLGAHLLFSNMSVTPRLIEREPLMTTVMLILYGIIFVVGVFGNSLIVYVVLRDKTMHTVTNKFIACLSVSDLLMCIFAIPFTPINALGKSWSYGEFLCKLVPVILLISVFVSTLTSVMIAIDRYVVILHPHVKRMTAKTQLAIIIAIWILSASTAVPIGVYTTLEPKADGTYDCHERWPNQSSAEIYTWLIFGLQVVIPAIIISVCYTAIGVSLRRRTRNRWAQGCHNNHKMKQEQKEMSKNRRINRMLIAMIVIFIMCWLPLDLIHVAAQHLTSEKFLTAFLFCHILAMSSVMYNPILYAWLNENFNKHFRELGHQVILRCKKKQGSLTNSELDDNASNPTRNFNLSIEEAYNAAEEQKACTDCADTAIESEPMISPDNEGKNAKYSDSP